MIVLEDVSKVFYEGTPKAFTALKHITLEIKSGEFVVLSGVSGSGKSTLLSLIGALDKPSSGKIAVMGELVSKLPDLHASAYRAKQVGMVFQHFHLIDSLSVKENTLLPLIHSGLSMQAMEQRALESMQSASIDHKAAARVGELSGGEKQRCAIARALVNAPKLLICDEPTANLDRENSLKFIEILEHLHQEGKTIIVATHDPLFDSLPFVSRVIRMKEGEIVERHA